MKRVKESYGVERKKIEVAEKKKAEEEKKTKEGRRKSLLRGTGSATNISLPS